MNSTLQGAALRWAAVLATAAVVLAVPTPSGIAPGTWHLFAIFAATIAGSILTPVPAGAVVFLGVTTLALTGTLTPAKALGGYSEPLVWLVLCAFFMSRGVLKTGLGRRIAYLFIRAIGSSSLGLAYALVGTDTLLASFLPSNSARAGGVVFPVARSLAEAYDSQPGPTARRLGAYLLFTVYQCDVVACAAFLTGQVSNVLAAKFAHDTAHVELSYTTWLLGASVPALLTLVLLPRLLFALYPPEITRTPDAARMATDELHRMGPMSRGERVMLVVFGAVALTWMTTPFHHLDYTVVAMAGVSALFLAGVLTWDDITSERGAWDVFLWYGGLVRMAGAIGESGLTTRFAQATAGMTTGWSWGAALVVLVLVFFFAHYAFASITAHITAMFTPFLVVLLAAGAPPMLAVLLLAYTANLGAAFTHYGTTTSPIYFGAGYVTQRDWWRLGAVAGVVSLTIFAGVGVFWWRLVGLW
jgi:DASS family divalent anion:Na+ symporter